MAPSPYYIRERDLHCLIDPRAGTPLNTKPQIVEALRRALQAERGRGLRQHWAYDSERHRMLLQAYLVEAGHAFQPPDLAPSDQSAPIQAVMEMTP